MFRKTITQKSRNSSRSTSKNKNKSRSKSKKRSYSKKGNFYFNQKSVFLTYPHTEKYGISKDELGQYLYTTFNCSVTVVCLEHHQDGNPHLHAWLEFYEQFYTKNYNVFNYKGLHPNIGKMNDIRKNTRENVLNYMLKEDNNL